MAKGQTIFAALLTLALTSGCSARDPHNELARNIKDVRSWAADACLVADRWRQRSVPTHYALDALDDAERGLREQATGIGKQEEAAPEARRAALDAAGRVLVLTQQLRRSIEQGDGAGATRASRDISEVRDTLMRLASQESAVR